MAIDRTGRERLRNALLGYMQMRINSAPFAHCVADFGWSDNADHSLVVIAEYLYNIFDDFSDHQILRDASQAEQLLRDPWPAADDGGELLDLKRF